MPKFSANLGFLWPELPLVEQIRAAGQAGFAAVECHFPYDVPVRDVRGALAEADLPMLALNTRRGDPEAGDFGLAAIPGREPEAQRFIDEAIDYGEAISARAVHVMAGRSGGGDAAEAVFRDNLAHAADRAAKAGMVVLVEPINRRDAPDYHVCRVEDAATTVRCVGAPNIRIMFDCYHIQISEGDVIGRLETHLDLIGHVQIAAVPDRGEPDAGEVDYPAVLGALDAMGYSGFVGAEYRPRASTDAGLGWMAAYAA